MAVKKYIELQKALNACEMHYDNIRRDIETLPTADVVEVKHGEWIVDGDITECSNCHKEYVTARGMLQLKEFDYCPYCGAKMDGSKTE